MSDIVKLVPHRSRSKKIVHDCLRRVLNKVTRQPIELIGVFMIDSSGRVHIERIGPVTWEQTDAMLSALEQLHEEIYLALREY